MTRLSVNINKIALIRNARGGNMPNLAQTAQDIEAFGGQGITVHPRPDQRHIRYDDIPVLKSVVTTEFNIEGNPTPAFMDLVLQNRPHQVTLVPDPPDVLTSDTGWDMIRHRDFLREVVTEFKKAHIRVSLFCNPDPRMVAAAADTGTDRIELYTGNYAKQFPHKPRKAIQPYLQAAKMAATVGLGLNAGHDLNLENLKYFKENCPHLLEVSIGHALICDALYFGLANTVRMYLRCLQ